MAQVKSKMLYIYKKNALCDISSLRQAAGIADMERPVVSVAGAGGKTSTIRQLAEEYIHSGQKVIVMTTTHLMAEEEPWFLLEPSEKRMKEVLEKYSQVWVGRPAQNGRMGPVPDDFLDVIWNMGLPVLIEADGARQLPLKVPGDQEPVILPQTTHLLSVYGLDGIGGRIRDVFFRPERAAELLGRQQDDPVSVEDVAYLAASADAGRKGCPADASYTVILNKADSLRLKARALEISRELEKAGIGRIIVSSREED